MIRQAELDLLTRIAKNAHKVGLNLSVTDSERWLVSCPRCWVVSSSDPDVDFRLFAFELMRQIEETGRAYFYRRGKIAKGTSNWWADLGMRKVNAAGCFGTEHLAMLECIAITLEALPKED